MPKEVSREILDRNRNIILQTLESFGGRRYATAAATRMIIDNYVSTRMKPVLKQLVRGREEELRQRFGVDLFSSEASGSWGKYQWGIATSIAHMASVDGTPLSELGHAVFVITDHYMPNYFRTKETRDLPGRPVSREKARPTNDFRRLVRNIAQRMHSAGLVVYDDKREIVYRGEVDPVELTVNFWGDILHKSQSSFKRTVSSAVASLNAPEFSQMPGLIMENHLGMEYGYRPRDADKWWLLTGDDGAGFAFMDTVKRVHLQYEKARPPRASWEKEESEQFRNVSYAIRMMPFVSREQIKRTMPTDYVTAVKIWNERKELSPLDIAGCLMSRELGALLKLGTKDPIGLEQNNARPVLQELWNYLDPKVRIVGGQSDLNEIKEASDATIAILSGLYKDLEFTPTTPMETNVLNGLSAYVDMQTPGRYMLKKGMDDAMGYLALYAGIII